MKVLIGTKNPGKVEGLAKAFKEYFDSVEVVAIAVKSGVGEQPVNDQTYIGCCNRVKNLKAYAKLNGIEADYFTAVESGIVKIFDKWQIVNVAVIEDNNDLHAYGTSAGFPIPEHLAERTISSELSRVMDEVLKRDKDARFGKGGIGLLTQDRITRIDLTYQAFIMALTQVLNKNWRELAKSQDKIQKTEVSNDKVQETTIHELKILPKYYKAVKDGTKTFEVRFNDRGYKVGDVLVLKEHDGEAYSGDSVLRVITYVLDDAGYCKDGYVVLGIKERK